MDQVVFLVYRFFLLPLIYGLVHIIALLKIQNKFFESLQFRLANEFVLRPSYDSKKKSIGVHAASGEIEYAFPLIRKIKEMHPDYNIVVTLSSKSVLKTVINQQYVDAVGPAPIDMFDFVGAFLNKFDFQLFLFARTDVWPELSYQLKKRSIPACLFSATFSQESAKKGKHLNVLTRFALNQLPKILCVSESDRQNIKDIGVTTDIDVAGDTRYDQVFYKKEKEAKVLPYLTTTKKIFVAGSTWPEDEAVLLPALVYSKSVWASVIAPHEVTNETVHRLEMFFAQHQMRTVRLSLITPETASMGWDVLIVDKYGYLFQLYSWARLTFVGGSFKSKVHSVMEPLSFFKPVCVGPLHENNREALEFGKVLAEEIQAPWVQTVTDTAQLEKLLHKHGALSEARQQQMATQLAGVIDQRRGSSERVYEAIRTLVTL